MKNSTPTLTRYQMDKAKAKCFNRFVANNKEYTLSVKGGKYIITFKIKKCSIKDSGFGEEWGSNYVKFSVAATYKSKSYSNGKPIMVAPCRIGRSTATFLNRRVRSEFGNILSTDLKIFGLFWPDVCYDSSKIKIDWEFDSPSGL
jgi:hypothetical protein